MHGLHLIFLHTPKTAGTSFQQIVLNHFGEDRVFLDYAESPANPVSACNLDPIAYYRRAQSEAVNIVRTKAAVYGHFPILKYAGCDAFRATFLRHPIERALSQYYYWKHLPVSNHPLHEYFLKMKLTVLEFFQLPHIAGFYSEIFFPKDQIRRFDFVGDFDKFPTEAARLGKSLGMDITDVPVMNANPDQKYLECREAFLGDGATMALARDLLRTEIALYEDNVGK